MLGRRLLRSMVRGRLLGGLRCRVAREKPRSVVGFSDPWSVVGYSAVFVAE